MTTALYCVLIAGLMPFLWTITAKVIGSAGKGYNNRDPRRWQSALTGLPARAHAAHLNSFEAFPLFAVAVIVAQMNNADQTSVDSFAIGFIVLRLLYGFAYLANQAILRSLLWFAAIVCTALIFLA